MKQEIHIPENLSLHELMDSQHGLFGEVTIHRRNKKTGEVAFWYQDHNIIPISGMQWILMKMFGLYLDTPHGVSYENLGKDTTLVIPELNQSGIMGIGTKPSNYTVMDENISSNHIVQGFMVGNGGAGEDQLTTKNTDYSFINLRNPIPFQQTNESLPGDIASKYMGRLQVSSSSGYAKSYYIKSFDDTPHIYHSWWRDGQRWDYVDPVVPADLGPRATNGGGKTNRIETYVECKLTIDETDFAAYFSHDGNNQTPAINELGLVAFDRSAYGEQARLERCYATHVKPILDLIFKNHYDEITIEGREYLRDKAHEAYETIYSVAAKYNQENLVYLSENLFNSLYIALNDNPHMSVDTLTALLEDMKTNLAKPECINVIASYDQYGNYLGETDTYLELVDSIEYDTVNTDEAQRIKLITYYTFKSIPIEENWETIINYRIYAN